MKEKGGRIGTLDIGSEFPKRELNQRTKVIRADNPLIRGLRRNSNNFQRFAELTNDLIKACGGICIELPKVEMVEKDKGWKKEFTVIALPYAGKWDEKRTESIRNLLRSLYQTKILQEGAVSKPSKAIPQSIFITTEVEDYKKVAADKIVGFVLKGALSKEAGARELEIRRHDDSDGSSSEVEMVYETVMSSLILAGKIDLSSEQALEKSLSFRRSLFIHIYHELLEEMMPFAKKENIYGLDNQINDIETNLYNPLIRGNGKPMNTLLAGAPGVGKTFVGSYFASKKDVLTVPLPIKYIIDAFEHYVAPRLSRIKNAFGIPVVVLVEDVEGLLEAAISVDAGGGMSQIIDPQKRALALSLLERMQDTHKMYLLCSLNHPDVEAAFLRRLNTIYFPLPSDSQRAIVLEDIIDSEHGLSDNDRRTLIEEFLELTKGFNYSGLMLIADYVENIELKSNNYRLEGQVYENALRVGYNKAKSRLNKAGLEKFDKAARKMVGLDEKDPAKIE